MRISVVIPTCNRAHIVTRAIESVLAQTLAADQIIVVDDGSTDETHRVVSREFGSRVHYTYQRNAGVSAARNTGVREASGEWVAFLDSDDEWAPGMLMAKMESASRWPGAHVHVANGAFVVDEHRQVNLLEMRHEHRLAQEGPKQVARPFTLALRCCFLIQACVARRAILLQSGLFDPTYSLFEDMDLLARLSLLTPFVVGGPPLVRVLRKGDATCSLSHNGLADRNFANRSLVSILSKLKTLPGLNRHESVFLDRMLSGARYELAAEQLRHGERRLGRNGLLRSMRDSASVGSVGRASLGLIFGRAGISFANLIRSRRRPRGAQIPGR